ncbi:hypothetical protein [Paractinoplanes globisporus]|uniref:hypothetical protein n=1 Tax=Paractinoplanes globisporus TaxID=113565 RepID=UPI0004777CEC|nr:hypothetical protein [Actinoplanes globisporus]
MTASLHVIAGMGSGRLAIIPHPRGDDWADDQLSALAGDGVSVLVSALTTAEQQEMGLGGTVATAAKLGVDFLPFPSEGAEPRDEASEVVGLAGRLAAHVRAGRFVATQCFGGVGRSTLLACTTLVLLGVGPGEALRRVTGGSPTPVTRDWLHEHSVQHAVRI